MKTTPKKKTIAYFVLGPQQEKHFMFKTSTVEYTFEFFYSSMDKQPHALFITQQHLHDIPWLSWARAFPRSHAARKQSKRAQGFDFFSKRADFFTLTDLSHLTNELEFLITPHGLVSVVFQLTSARFKQIEIRSGLKTPDIKIKTSYDWIFSSVGNNLDKVSSQATVPHIDIIKPQYTRITSWTTLNDFWCARYTVLLQEYKVVALVILNCFIEFYYKFGKWLISDPFLAIKTKLSTTIKYFTYVVYLKDGLAGLIYSISNHITCNIINYGWLARYVIYILLSP